MSSSMMEMLMFFMIMPNLFGGMFGFGSNSENISGNQSNSSLDQNDESNENNTSNTDDFVPPPPGTREREFDHMPDVPVPVYPDRRRSIVYDKREMSYFEEQPWLGRTLESNDVIVSDGGRAFSYDLVGMI